MKPKVLITLGTPAENLTTLDGIADVEQWEAGGSMMPREEVMKRISDLTAILSQGELKIDSELMDAAPHLRIVANGSVGFDNFDLALMTRRLVWGTNAPDSFTDICAPSCVRKIGSRARSENPRREMDGNPDWAAGRDALEWKDPRNRGIRKDRAGGGKARGGVRDERALL